MVPGVTAGQQDTCGGVAPCARIAARDRNVSIIMRATFLYSENLPARSFTQPLLIRAYLTENNCTSTPSTQIKNLDKSTKRPNENSGKNY